MKTLAEAYSETNGFDSEGDQSKILGQTYKVSLDDIGEALLDLYFQSCNVGWCLEVRGNEIHIKMDDHVGL